MGLTDGNDEGGIDGLTVEGLMDGAKEGLTVGLEGLTDGDIDGLTVKGLIDGGIEKATVGGMLCSMLGFIDSCDVGEAVGMV